jgi:hypothetical protein
VERNLSLDNRQLRGKIHLYEKERVLKEIQIKKLEETIKDYSN